uniref:HMG box domain-containing protein n=1 Tax=Pycnococcus provasolii TaxID=41880 RepID=A0A7S2AZ56_9CHLO|mmetsp:Transcript_4111/g.9281  ORF Transcript_4111/g.9281 Transcript_4111/m.9281 type:complete len:131 (+) Transcript_4111:35-427(+)
MASSSSVSLMSPLRRMCLSSSMSSSVCYQVANVAPAFALGGMFAVRSYGRKANAAPAPPKAASAPEKKVPRQKREPSAYAKFVKAKFTSVRTDLARQHGKPLADIKLPEVSAVMSQEWKGLTDDEKAKFK